MLFTIMSLDNNSKEKPIFNTVYSVENDLFNKILTSLIGFIEGVRLLCRLFVFIDLKICNNYCKFAHTYIHTFPIIIIISYIMFLTMNISNVLRHINFLLDQEGSKVGTTSH